MADNLQVSITDRDGSTVGKTFYAPWVMAEVLQWVHEERGPEDYSLRLKLGRRVPIYLEPDDWAFDTVLFNTLKELQHV